MEVDIILNREDATYTNHDILSGRVVLSIPNSTCISSIVVRLDGESTIRLPSPDRGEPSRQWLSKAHKIVQRTQHLFPPMQFKDKNNNGPLKLGSGKHGFPFQFAFPLTDNHHPSEQDDKTTRTSKRLSVHWSKQAAVSGGQMLPPSFTYLNSVNIHYFVTASVVTPALLKPNLRAIIGLDLFPIHPLLCTRFGDFSMIKQLQLELDSGGSTTPQDKQVTLNIETYLQHGDILIFQEDVPLRILIQDFGGSSGDEKNSHLPLYLQNLQIMVLGYTHLRVKGATSIIPDSWTILSLSNLNTVLSPDEKKHGGEISVDHSLWSKRPLPKAVVPSFEGGDISRRYELEIKIGLQYASGNTKLISMCFPVQVSGRRILTSSSSQVETHQRIPCIAGFESQESLEALPEQDE